MGRVTSVRTSGLKVSANSHSGSDAFLSNFCCKCFPRKTLCSTTSLSCLGDAPFSGDRERETFKKKNIFWIIGVKETGGYYRTSRRRDFSPDTQLCRNNPLGRLIWVICIINAVHAVPRVIFLFVLNDLVDIYTQVDIYTHLVIQI